MYSHRIERVVAVTQTFQEAPERVDRWAAYYAEQGCDTWVLVEHGPPRYERAIREWAVRRGASAVAVRPGSCFGRECSKRLAMLVDFALEQYAVVLMVDIDEYLVYCPEDAPRQRLADLFLGLDLPVIAPYAYEVIQDLETEPPLDWSKPLLRQRRYWARWDYMDKPIVVRVMPNWVSGRHFVTLPGSPVPARVPGLYLIHLRRADYEYMVKRNQLYGQLAEAWWRATGQHDRRRWYFSTVSALSPEELRDQWRLDERNKVIVGKIEEIPERVRKCL